MKILTSIILIFFSIHAFSQEMVEHLGGFQIGQYRSVVVNELGSPFKKEKFDDGFEYEVYIIKPDSSVYMIFEYSPRSLQIIWSIQLTGKDFGTGFKNLKLGDEKDKVLKQLGNPSNKGEAGEYGDRWEFEKTNYSIEINKRGKLSSIKIKDDSHKLFPTSNVDKFPSFDIVKTELQSNDRSRIKTLLCPDIEITFNNSNYTFKKSIQNEIDQDESGLFKLINQLAKELTTVDPKNKDEYEEGLRIVPKQDPLYVIKIKKGAGIKEIVLQYRFGRFLIWEIKTFSNG